MKIAVLGATGMLGHTVAEYLASVYGEDNIFRTARTIYCTDPSQRWAQLEASEVNSHLWGLPHDLDYVINCIGIIKPFIEATGIEKTIQVNSLFPHRLARWCKTCSAKLIHITTDCVYSGKKGWYDEEAPHDCSDVYGQTKSLGEPIADAMVLRTSIIGREIHKNASLVAWVQSMKDQTVDGYTTHIWNGMTTRTYAECCRRIIDNGWWTEGLFHIFSPNSVSKCELVEMISDALDLGVKVIPSCTPELCDRTLTTIKSLCSNLQIPDLHEQMKGL